jgi:hypothetical protein
MKTQSNFRFLPRLAIALAFAGVLFAQSTANKVLVVNGKSAGAVVRQIDGHSYVDIETLAQVANGTVTVGPTQVAITIPMTNSGAPATIASQPPPARSVQPMPQGLSRNFAAAAIGVLEDMREWRGAVHAMITYGGAMRPDLAQYYAQRAQVSLAQAAVAASTDDDRNALSLLQNEGSQLDAWANGVISAQKNMNGSAIVDPNALANDPAYTKIQNCGQFLNSMLVSGTFSDDGSCH